MTRKTKVLLVVAGATAAFAGAVVAVMDAQHWADEHLFPNPSPHHHH